jgi:dihydrofolate reductase
MVISLIAALDERNGIGRRGLLPWHPRKAKGSLIASFPQLRGSR